MHDIVSTLTKLANQYPDGTTKGQIQDINRISFHINLALNSVNHKRHSDIELCDLGGGIGLFSIGCAAYGIKRTVLIDDFDDSVNHFLGNSILSLHKNAGVEVISRDVIVDGISDIKGTFDVITTFDSMEHWHHSPKNLFHEVANKLKSQGVFILGVPNCVNMRKRITLPFGIGKWSKMEDWYEVRKFRGHVREPDVEDLVYIANDMGLVDIKIYGRNWLGYCSSHSVVRAITKLVDYPLRFIPSLCSDIYLVGRKP